MNEKFKHYLITRYNIRIDNFSFDHSGHPTLDDEWMEHRFDLFARYCLPTVLNQSEKNFNWIIYLDTHTKAEFVNQINSLIKEHTHIHLHFVNGYEECKKDLDEVLSRSDTPFIITSRLDNDDGLGQHFISTVQTHFIARNFTIINLLHGDAYNSVRHIATRMYNMRKNHFCSFIEEIRPEGGHITVRGFQHGSPPEEYQIVDVPSHHSWIKLFHDRNLKSNTFGYPVLFPPYDKFFGLQMKHIPVSFINTVTYTCWWIVDWIQRKWLRSNST